MSRKTCRRSCTRAPFRLLPIRAPRQAVLRTSSRLAPSLFTNRPCDLPVEKTRDASNRCLPPKRTACTRTSCVPGSRSQLSLRGHPTESSAPRGSTGGPDVSRRPRPLRRTAVGHASHPSSLAAFHDERGRFLPTMPVRSNLWHPCREPRSPSRLTRFRECCLSPSVLLLKGFERVGGCGDRQDHPYRRLVKVGAS
jgi:hypothetical protein